MRLSIIGAGNVGKALAHAFIRQGEEVFFGVPNPEKYQSDVAALGPMASLGTTTSAAEQLASWAPTAKVVKAFNTTGAENMANASFAQGLPFTTGWMGENHFLPVFGGLFGCYSTGTDGVLMASRSVADRGDTDLVCPRPAD